MHINIYSFIQAISLALLQAQYQLEALLTDIVSKFHAEAPQATASEGLAQGPYATLRT